MEIKKKRKEKKITTAKGMGDVRVSFFFFCHMGHVKVSPYITAVMVPSPPPIAIAEVIRPFSDRGWSIPAGPCQAKQSRIHNRQSVLVFHTFT